MKFESLKEFSVMNGKDKKVIRPGKSLDSRDLGITDKSMAELAKGGFVHIAKGEQPAALKGKTREEGK